MRRRGRVAKRAGRRRRQQLQGWSCFKGLVQGPRAGLAEECHCKAEASDGRQEPLGKPANSRAAFPLRSSPPLKSKKLASPAPPTSSAGHARPPLHPSGDGVGCTQLFAAADQSGPPRAPLLTAGQPPWRTHLGNRWRRAAQGARRVQRPPLRPLPRRCLSRAATRWSSAWCPRWTAPTRRPGQCPLPCPAASQRMRAGRCCTRPRPATCPTTGQRRWWARWVVRVSTTRTASCAHSCAASVAAHRARHPARTPPPRRPQDRLSRRQQLLHWTRMALRFLLAQWLKFLILGIIITLIVLVSVKVRQLQGLRGSCSLPFSAGAYVALFEARLALPVTGWRPALLLASGRLCCWEAASSAAGNLHAHCLRLLCRGSRYSASSCAGSRRATTGRGGASSSACTAPWWRCFCPASPSSWVLALSLGRWRAGKLHAATLRPPWPCIGPPDRLQRWRGAQPDLALAACGDAGSGGGCWRCGRAGLWVRHWRSCWPGGWCCARRSLCRRAHLLASGRVTLCARPHRRPAC